MKKIILLAITSVGLLCFTAATISFMLNYARPGVIWEGWLTALFSLYVKDRYQIYLNRKEKRECGCYEKSK